jgi:hypothetical protein
VQIAIIFIALYAYLVRISVLKQYKSIARRALVAPFFEAASNRYRLWESTASR